MGTEEKVRQYLKSKGISQRHIARVTGMSPSTLNLTLSGKRRMQIDELVRICKATEKEPAYFLCDTG